MRQHPIEQAINEQVRGFVPEEGLDKGIKYKGLTKEQIWQPRRSTETIMVEMADKMKTCKELDPDSQNKKKRRRRRRRRGPKVLAANYYDEIK
jgi:hypothetical protein